MFSDIFESGQLYELLDDAAKAPIDAPKKLFNFIHHAQYSHIRKELRKLRDRIISTEKKHGVIPGTSEESILLLDLDILLKNCISTNNLRNNLPEIKFKLSQANVIASECERDRLALLAEHGALYLKNQKEKSKKAISIRWGGGHRKKINEIIKLLSERTDELGDLLESDDLWTEFLGELDQVGLNPQDDRMTEVNDKSWVKWDGNLTKMTFKTFKNNLSKYRKK